MDDSQLPGTQPSDQTQGVSQTPTDPVTLVTNDTSTNPNPVADSTPSVEPSVPDNIPTVDVPEVPAVPDAPVVPEVPSVDDAPVENADSTSSQPTEDANTENNIPPANPIDGNSF